jgi:hypothetical protein
MVWNPSLLRERHLVGADVEAAVDGRRVATDDLAAEPFRQREREGALPGGGRTENGNHFVGARLQPRRNSSRHIDSRS